MRLNTLLSIGLVMNWIAFSGALELGFIYGLVGLGVYLSFRVLDFPDLTVDGSFPLGGAVAATLIVNGLSPLLATAIAILAGGLAGLCTAWLSVQFNILNLLASILTMIALYSINLRIMGQPNVSLLGESTLLTPLQGLLEQLPKLVGVPLIMFVVVIASKLCLDAFLASEIGLAMRATGSTPTMAEAQGIRTGSIILGGLALSNGLVALAGALFAQTNGFADVSLGVGTIVFGLAAVIIGEALIGVVTGGAPLTVPLRTLGVLLGAVVYRLAIALALNADWIGLQAQDLNLVTAVLVAIALIVPQSRKLLQRNS